MICRPEMHYWRSVSAAAAVFVLQLTAAAYAQSPPIEPSRTVSKGPKEIIYYNTITVSPQPVPTMPNILQTAVVVGTTPKTTTPLASTTHNTTTLGLETTSGLTMAGSGPTPALILNKTLVCDRGWLLFHGHCYYMSTTDDFSVPYNESQQTCKDEGGYLAEIGSYEEMDFLSRHVPAARYWIGWSLYSMRMRLTNSSSFAYYKLILEQATLKDKCPIFSPQVGNKTWMFTEANCDEKKNYFMCERDVTGSYMICPGGNDIDLGNKCVRVSPVRDKVNHSTSLDACRNINGSLFMPNDQLELKNLSQRLGLFSGKFGNLQDLAFYANLSKYANLGALSSSGNASRHKRPSVPDVLTGLNKTPSSGDANMCGILRFSGQNYGPGKVLCNALQRYMCEFLKGHPAAKQKP